MPNVFIPGLVVPKARPRFNTHTGRVYTDPKYKAYLEMATDVVALYHRGDPIMQEVAVVMKFTPEGVDVTYEAATAAATWTSRKGDLDNMVGSVMDAMQKGGALSNDRNVVSIMAWVE